MPKVQKVEDGFGTMMPLRITRRRALKKEHKKRPLDARMLVRCGCCKERFEIYPPKDPDGNIHSNTLEINGVFGTVYQWRQVFGPLLGLPVEYPDYPLYQMKVEGKEKFLSIGAAGVAFDNGWVDVEIGGLVLEGPQSVRTITKEERERIREIADEHSASK
ncbi:MAG: hypothetical protein WDZ93_03230 [Candidatus Paceibacterota bacterium]